eukprot:5439385-Prymnesium_polylepis.1
MVMTCAYDEADKTLMNSLRKVIEEDPLAAAKILGLVPKDVPEAPPPPPTEPPPPLTPRDVNLLPMSAVKGSNKFVERMHRKSGEGPSHFNLSVTA